MTADIRKNNSNKPFGAYFSGPSKTSFLNENWGVRMFSSGNIDKAFGSTSYNNASYVGYIKETPPLIHYIHPARLNLEPWIFPKPFSLFIFPFIQYVNASSKNRVFATL